MTTLKKLFQLKRAINGITETYRGVDMTCYAALSRASVEIRQALTGERRRMAAAKNRPKPVQSQSVFF